MGRSPFLLLGDHAGRAIPYSLRDLGLAEPDLSRHIAWDIGVAALGQTLSQRLDAVFVAQTWSRLVIDCNRDPDAADAIPLVSDGTDIPGNAGLTAWARRQRIDEIHAPYQDAIASEIERRRRIDLSTILISLHSFTPRMQQFDRPWDVGALYDGGNTRFALAVLELMRRDASLIVGDNAPYRMDTLDYTVPRHAYSSGLPYLELEIRQDHLSTEAGIAHWADRLQDWLTQAATLV